jgi:hypothetical protein
MMFNNWHTTLAVDREHFKIFMRCGFAVVRSDKPDSRKRNVSGFIENDVESFSLKLLTIRKNKFRRILNENKKFV